MAYHGTYMGPKVLHRCAKCGWTGYRAARSSVMRKHCPKCGHYKPEKVEKKK